MNEDIILGLWAFALFSFAFVGIILFKEMRR